MILSRSECPLCAGTVSQLWMDQSKPTHYNRCRSCGTVYASPYAPPEERFAWLDEHFSAGDLAEQNAAYRQPALAVEAELIKHHKTTGRLLDIGCNLGDFFAGFPDPAWQRFGVELSPSAAAHAAKTYQAEVFVGQLQEAAYPSDAFDLVTMIDMFYYLDDPVSDLHEVGRIVKPDGLLALEITGQRYQFLRSRGPLCWLAEKRWTRLDSASPYLHWPSPQGMQRVLERAGLRVIAWYPVPHITSGNAIIRFALSRYYSFFKAANRHPSRLSYVPKYLCLAQPFH